MSSAVVCPKCKQRINVAVEQLGTALMCPMCKAPLPTGSMDQPVAAEPARKIDRPAPPQNHPYQQGGISQSHRPNQIDSGHPNQPPTGSSSGSWVLVIGCVGVMFLMMIVAVLTGAYLLSGALQQPRLKQTKVNSKSLLESRADNPTVILRKQKDGEPAPQPPGNLFQLVKYKTDLGPMSAYVSKPVDPTKKHPAIIWKFGGFDNGIGETAWTQQRKSNDQSAGAFRKQGVVMMYPALRGGNDNPGFNECFFGEVDDILAAREYLAAQDFVDPNRIYLGGHSTGGTLVLLCAAATDKFRAVFAFGPVDNIAGYGADSLPFDFNNQTELNLRNPIEWTHAIQSRTFVIEGADGNSPCVYAIDRTNPSDQMDCFVVKGTDHFGVLGPVNELLAKKVIADSGERCNIEITQSELDGLFRR